jgi:catechol 2,3-dioxygenase-like lactoylglutathione lyase family enzyme
MITNMHHVAYKCRDAEETRAFYEDLLGLPLTHVIKLDHVPSTGEYAPYVHIFFELKDTSFLAFFDIGDGLSTELDANTPPWLQHCAMEVGSMEELMGYRQKLLDAGVEVIGPTDHGFVQSIYFRDPNNLKMEFTTRIYGADKMAEHRKSARALLDEFTRDRKPLPA